MADIEVNVNLSNSIVISSNVNTTSGAVTNTISTSVTGTTKIEPSTSITATPSTSLAPTVDIKSGIPAKDGTDGTDGVGVPTGGNPGQVVSRDTLGGTEWTDQAYYQYIFNSSGIQSGNRYNNFADLMVSAGGRECRILFEQSETLPAGAYNVDSQTWLGTGTNPDDPTASVVTFPTGVTFSSANNWFLQNGISVVSTSINPVYYQIVATTHMIDRSFIGCTTAPFFVVSANGINAFPAQNGGGYKNYGYEVISVDGATPFGCFLASVKQGISSVYENNTIRSTVPVINLSLIQSTEQNYKFATQANLDPASVTQNILFSNARVITFSDGQPLDITSDNLVGALGELAPRSKTLLTTNTTPFTPTLDYHPATKKYVDSGGASYTLDISPGRLGDASNSGFSSSSSSVRKRVSLVDVSSLSLTLLELGCRVWTDTGTQKMKMMVYSDNAGTPDVLLATSDELTISNTSSAVNVFTMSGANQIDMSLYSNVWVGWINEPTGGNRLYFSHNNAGSGHRGGTITYASEPANPWGGGGSSTGYLDIFLGTAYAKITTYGGTYEETRGYDYTLPTAVGKSSSSIKIINTSGSSITITGTENIGNDGSASTTYTLTDGSILSLVSNGSVWRII